MSYHCERGAHFQYNWTSSQEGGQFLQAVWPRGQPRPLQWGLLETPPHPMAGQSWDSAGAAYKVAVIGRPGVGKSAFVAMVTGQTPPHPPSTELPPTPGLSVQRQFWPCRRPAVNRVLLCRLDFWDAGDAASASFEHLRHELLNRCDCVLFAFSAADRASYAELPQLVKRVTGVPGFDACAALLVTKLDLPDAQLVSQRDLKQLERDCRLPLLRFSPGIVSQEAACQLLTRLCECLWHRQQVLAGAIETSVVVAAPAATKSSKRK